MIAVLLSTFAVTLFFCLCVLCFYLSKPLLVRTWRRLPRVTKRVTYGWTPEDWAFVRLCYVTLLVAMWLKGW
jgi:hypothetical protein